MILNCEYCGKEIVKHKTRENKYNKVLCKSCRNKLDARGGTMKLSKYDSNEINVLDSCAEIILRGCNGEYVDTSLIDIQDVEKVQKYKWYKDSTGYVRTEINNEKIRLHNFLIITDEEHIVDHINSNRLDNRRENLQICTQQNNTQKKQKQSNNSSGIIGVSKNTNRDSWVSYIKIGDKKIKKTFKNFNDAKLYRFILELNYFNKFAPQIEIIKNEYPHLLHVLNLSNMKINEDIDRVKEVLNELKETPYCPCMIVQNENTICPCLPCRTKSICICKLFKNIENESEEN